MRRCLEISLRGKGYTAPNPMVGAVIVHRGVITGEGYHKIYGGAHAETNAIGNVKDPGTLKDSTLYVNLEPCSHFGKTPPCTDLIIKCGIPRVVIGTADPNPLVSGRGITRLKENGIEVNGGILESDCRHINRRFFTWNLHRRPWIILKWAQSADGFIDLVRAPGSPVGPNWITSKTARILVHKWRAEEQAILAGTNTVLKDNPRLNVRLWSGRDPLRVVIDRSLKLGRQHHVLDNSISTVVFTEPCKTSTAKERVYPAEGNNIRYVPLLFDDTVGMQMLNYLHSQDIQSLIIEGGAYTLSRFIEKNLWDEARVFTGPKDFRKGVKAPSLQGKIVRQMETGNSHLQFIYNSSSEFIP
ncbi:MAG: bifunctional diaminohydroxyphosphoribosylaminopyrimidine deaminase/5-amino-6-(5-phosphoribosylamino)uracil reductase RibD [Marinilabiliales bacterium]|nr:MAG: bifunctional diaminohydroxyphosphoribosylaminopyrimidine deaminase/5-amino-6-(5-phosphoribosylamino)uracil reductase RibD [Marinilabiliales bacterium]